MALFNRGDEKSYIIEQLHILLSAGMDVSSAIYSIAQEVNNHQLHESLLNVKKKIDGGTQLWKAFEGTGVIPEHFLSFIKTGEQSGRLKEQLEMVAQQYAREKEFRSKVISASIYPIFILIVVIVLGGVNAIVILPNVVDSFSKLGANLPPLTRALLAIGTFMKFNGLWFIPTLIIVFGILFYIIFFYPKTKHWGQEITLRLPGVKDIVRNVEIAKFGFIFGLLINSGITVVDALNFMTEYSTVRRYQKFYAYLAEGIENGKSFKTLFGEYNNLSFIFPYSVNNLVVTSENSGNLPETLLKIGDIYQKKVDISTQTLSVIIEPLLIIIVWFFVLLIALAIIYPLYSIIGNINQF